MLFGNGQAEPGDVLLIPPAQHREQIIAASCRFFEHAAESRRVKEPVVLCKPVALAARQP